MWVFELPQEDKLQALENICKETVYGHVKDYYQINAVKVDSTSAAPKSKPIGPELPPPSQPAALTAEEEEKKQAETAAIEDPFSVWQGDEIKTCDDLVYVLKLTNTTDEVMKFTLKFSLGEQAPREANLVWPREGLIGSIKANEVNKIIAVLPKLTADCSAEGTVSEIEKLQVTLEGRLDSKVKNAGGASDAAGAASNGVNNKNYQGTNESKHDVSVGGELAVAVSDTEKSCSACTSFNPIGATECFICLTKFQN